MGTKWHREKTGETEIDKGMEKLYILIALLVYKMMNGKERRIERINKNGRQKKQ